MGCSLLTPCPITIRVVVKTIFVRQIVNIVTLKSGEFSYKFYLNKADFLNNVSQGFHTQPSCPSKIKVIERKTTFCMCKNLGDAVHTSLS